ncbi:hypothetical protein J6590_016688 [Homalodisca vitripennis]|nr:hypothetical protein J6590_016688 [Homalodisca vitripennis]
MGPEVGERQQTVKSASSTVSGPRVQVLYGHDRTWQQSGLVVVADRVNRGIINTSLKILAFSLRKVHNPVYHSASAAPV